MASSSRPSTKISLGIRYDEFGELLAKTAQHPANACAVQTVHSSCHPRHTAVCTRPARTSFQLQFILQHPRAAVHLALLPLLTPQARLLLCGRFGGQLGSVIGILKHLDALSLWRHASVQHLRVCSAARGSTLCILASIDELALLRRAFHGTASAASKHSTSARQRHDRVQGGCCCVEPAARGLIGECMLLQSPLDAHQCQHQGHKTCVADRPDGGKKQ
jgi:hypothetical protein